jgi:hypothetical protein
MSGELCVSHLNCSKKKKSPDHAFLPVSKAHTNIFCIWRQYYVNIWCTDFPIDRWKKLKATARASMTTSDVNNQGRSNFQQQIISNK